MDQIDSPRSVPSPGRQQQEEHRVALHVQVEHYQKKSQDHKQETKIPRLSPVDSSLVTLFDVKGNDTICKLI